MDFKEYKNLLFLKMQKQKELENFKKEANAREYFRGMDFKQKNPYKMLSKKFISSK